MGRLVGIDLGTTNSVVAVMDGPSPRVLETSEFRRQMRSIVGLRAARRGRRPGSEDLLVGDPAFDNWEMSARDTIVSVKRLMGRGFGDDAVQRMLRHADVRFRIVEPSDGTRDSVRVILGEREFSPVDVSALILRKLKNDAERTLGEEVTHAVITVPAYFSQIQKEATRRAGQQAGLEVIKILDEPTAAAIAYGLDSGNAGQTHTVVVYDLGGGTFDVSVLMMAGGTFAPLDLEGDMWLGGDDFDQVIITRALAWLAEEYPGLEPDPATNDRFMIALRKAAQKTKEALSAGRAADLFLPAMLQDAERNPVDVDLTLTREWYEEQIGPLVDRTRTLVGAALDNVGLTPAEVDYVILAGNATGTPLVQRTMEEMFGAQKVMRRLNPKECVALGAAVVAAVIGPGRTVCVACGHTNPSGAARCVACGRPLAEPGPGGGPDAVVGASGAPGVPGEPGAQAPGTAGISSVVVQTIAPFAYGIEGAGGQMVVFVRKGEPCPTPEPRVHVFRTQSANARIIALPIYGGDDLDHAATNERQGDAFAILPPGLPVHTPVRVELRLDEHGRFTLSASLQDGRDLRPWVTVKGEAQEKAIAELEEAWRVFGRTAATANAATLERIEGLREEVFEAMRAGRFDDALATVRDLRASTDSLGRTGRAQSVRSKAENLVGFTTMLLDHFAWAFEPARRADLGRLRDAVSTALLARDEATLDRAVADLDRETDDLPLAVQWLLGLRAAIVMRIRPFDPAAATRLLADLDPLEQALAAHPDPATVGKLEDFTLRVQAALKEIPQMREGEECVNGHVSPGYERYCPVCHADKWRPEA